ncbi:MAG: hypothetical protein ACYTF8_12020, partial [Planctomycetota bacterium]
MTPYTSFLVLESDEDRERYGVTRRVKMRDGERFFAAGRDRAATELLAQQMKLARGWRLALRRRMMREIGTLGEFLQVRDGGLGEVASEVPLFGGQAEEVEPMAPFDADEEEVFEEEGEEEEEQLDFEAEEGEVQYEEPEFEVEEDKLRAPATPAPSGFRSIAGRRAYKGYRPRSEDFWGPTSLPAWQLGFPILDEPLKPLPDEPAPEWDAQVLALVRKLDRRAALQALAGGVEVRQEGGTVHALHGREISHETAHGIYGAPGWFVRTTSRWGEPQDAWLAGDERGVLAVGRRLGRRRTAAESDRRE